MKTSPPRSAWKARCARVFFTVLHVIVTSFTRRPESDFGPVSYLWSVASLLVVTMLPSPLITSSTTPFSVKDILKLELQQQSQQHQLQFISCLGFSGALSQPGALPNKPFRSHSPPSCMLAGRDSPSPISSSVSESEERMSYLSTLAAQDRLAESDLPVEMFGNPAQNHSVALRLETELEDQDSSKCNDKYIHSKVSEHDDVVV